MGNGQSDYHVGDVNYHLGETATLTYAQVRHSSQSSFTGNDMHIQSQSQALSRCQSMLHLRVMTLS
jgi:hypothetical protein